MQTLARFIQNKRNELGLTQKGLAIAANIPLEDVEEVEAGKELFLPVTVRIISIIRTYYLLVCKLILYKVNFMYYNGLCNK